MLQRTASQLQLSRPVRDKTMSVSVPITLNGVGPRLRKADPLWDVLKAVLLLIADRGERIRWRSTATPIGLDVQLLINGTWFDMVPPFWKVPDLVKRLVGLTAQSWWDWWRLRRLHQRHLRTGERLLWERTVTLDLRGRLIPAICRVDCDAQGAEVELVMVAPGEKLSAVARAALPGFQQLVIQNWERTWLKV
jgi:hypothetical protein